MAQQLWKTIVIFGFSTLEFALLQSFVKKIKILKCGTKHVIFPYFVAGIWKYYCHIWHQCPWICLLAKFGAKIKILKFGTKNAWFGYFWTGTWKLFCHIWNQDPRILQIAKFREKMKMPKFGTNNALFKYFWARVWKWYCHIWNQNPRICLIANFVKKQKHHQKCVIWVFLGWDFTKLLSYLKLAASNLSYCKILWRNKNDYIWDQNAIFLVFFTKNALFEYFWARILKTIVRFEISTLEFV